MDEFEATDIRESRVIELQLILSVWIRFQSLYLCPYKVTLQSKVNKNHVLLSPSRKSPYCEVVSGI